MADVLELENAEEFEDDSISRMKVWPFLYIPSLMALIIRGQ